MALSVTETEIPGLLTIELPLHGDSRGWFKETWQRAKMTDLGLPDFGPVQNNISFNDEIGTTRGIHAEPWDKLISVATGKIFGAWVDLREGPTFGTTFTCEIDPSRAVFVPRGVANSYQTLEPHTAYTYLVNDHWSPEATYTNVNLADPSLGISWPIPLSDAEISVKDQGHPPLSEVTPVAPRTVLVVGSYGMLGRALELELSDWTNVEYVDRDTFDILADLEGLRDWRQYRAIINAAAYTAVDQAETSEGRLAAWAANAAGVRNLAIVAAEYQLTLVHVSTDYVFDGAKNTPYMEDDPVCPVSVYGQTKAAGDLAAATAPQHYILRTSWVVGDGKNFVLTMRALAERGVDPKVVDDQFGRLTFTSDLARAIRHLLESNAEYGIYNTTSAGPPQTWKQIAGDVFELTGHERSRVTGVTTKEYFASSAGPVAVRPRNSMLDLSKIETTGFVPRDQGQALQEYLAAF